MPSGSNASSAKGAQWRLGPGAGLGVVLILAAIVVLVDVAMVAHFSALLIGWVALLSGGFEVVAAALKRRWLASAPRLLLGLFYISFGLAFLQHGEFRAVLISYILTMSLVGSGVVRIAMGVARKVATPWFVLSGGVGVAAGLAILFNWAGSSDRAIGLLLGVDLLLHGVAWLAWSRATTREPEQHYA